MKSLQNHLMHKIEEMRIELDLAREHLRKLEDSFETSKFTGAEDRAVLAIMHMKRILRKLAERQVEINDFNSKVSTLHESVEK